MRFHLFSQSTYYKKDLQSPKIVFTKVANLVVYDDPESPTLEAIRFRAPPAGLSVFELGTSSAASASEESQVGTPEIGASASSSRASSGKRTREATGCSPAAVVKMRRVILEKNFLPFTREHLIFLIFPME